MDWLASIFATTVTCKSQDIILYALCYEGNFSEHLRHLPPFEPRDLVTRELTDVCVPLFSFLLLRFWSSPPRSVSLGPVFKSCFDESNTRCCTYIDNKNNIELLWQNYCFCETRAKSSLATRVLTMG